MGERSIPVLRTALKRYPHITGLSSGAITDPRVRLTCVEVEPSATRYMRPMCDAYIRAWMPISPQADANRASLEGNI